MDFPLHRVGTLLDRSVAARCRLLAARTESITAKREPALPDLSSRATAIDVSDQGGGARLDRARGEEGASTLHTVTGVIESGSQPAAKKARLVEREEEEEEGEEEGGKGEEGDTEEGREEEEVEEEGKGGNGGNGAGLEERKRRRMKMELSEEQRQVRRCGLTSHILTQLFHDFYFDMGSTVCTCVAVIPPGVQPNRVAWVGVVWAWSTVTSKDFYIPLATLQSRC